MKVETYNIKGWSERQTGLLVAENKDWILVKHLPLDYLVDGYKLYQKKYIKARKNKSPEKQIERVLKLKGVENSPPEGFEFADPLSVLKWSESKYGLFEFQGKDEDRLFYGVIKKAKEDNFKIKMIKSNGELDDDFKVDFSLSKIRSITFETDYFKSILLLMADARNSKA